MAIKHPREDFRANEENYFHKLDSELIEQIREREKAKAEEAERAAHRGHCADCGGNMVSWSLYGMQGFVCTDCEQVEMQLQTLKVLVMSSDGKEVLKQITQAVGKAILKTA
jgi:hypothetical protein